MNMVMMIFLFWLFPVLLTIAWGLFVVPRINQKIVDGVVPLKYRTLNRAIVKVVGLSSVPVVGYTMLVFIVWHYFSAMTSISQWLKETPLPKKETKNATE